MKTRLGQFLLKGFKRKKVYKRPNKKRKRQIGRLRVSQMHLTSHLSDRVSHTRVSEDLKPTPQEVPVPIQVQAIPEPPSSVSEPSVSLTNVSAPNASLPIDSLVEIPQAPLGHSGLSTRDLVKPSDALKQSIEAFLLDQRSPHTRRAYGKDLKRFIQFLISRNYNQGVEALNRTLLIGYKEFLISEKRHTRPSIGTFLR